MARILGVGVAALDVILELDRFPAEDAEMRAAGRRVARGGNAGNTLAVLARLGHDCAWAGILGDGPESRLVLSELRRQGVAIAHCRQVPGAAPPTSYALLSRATGSRTIVHHRALPEYGYEDFQGVPLGGLDWLHFEGRNPPETRRMMERARAERPDLSISLEVEKPREQIESLFPLAQVLLFSRGYAGHRGFDGGEAFLAAMSQEAPTARLFCAWGAGGAYAKAPGEAAVGAGPYAPAQVVDTLGAGDVFNAGVIAELLAGEPVQSAVADGCRLAGRKCGYAGLEDFPIAEGDPIERQG